jgi:hypothetical protein
MQMRDDNEQREFRLEKKIETFFLKTDCHDITGFENP